MSKQISTVTVIIETGGDVPTQVKSNSVHDVNNIRNKFKNALVDYYSSRPALVEIETGDEVETVLFFPVESIKMLSVQKIPEKKMIEIAQAAPPVPKLM